MAPKKAKSVEVEFDIRSDKKHVVRFDSSDENAAVTSIYISKVAMQTLGDPQSLTVTIEAA